MRLRRNVLAIICLLSVLGSIEAVRLSRCISSLNRILFSQNGLLVGFANHQLFRTSWLRLYVIDERTSEILAERSFDRWQHVTGKFSDQGELAVFSTDTSGSELRLLDGKTLKDRIIRKEKFVPRISHVCFSRDGRWLVVASNRAVIFLDVTTLEEHQRFDLAVPEGHFIRLGTDFAIAGDKIILYGPDQPHVDQSCLASVGNNYDFFGLSDQAVLLGYPSRSDPTFSTTTERTFQVFWPLEDRSSTVLGPIPTSSDEPYFSLLDNGNRIVRRFSKESKTTISDRDGRVICQRVSDRVRRSFTETDSLFYELREQEQRAVIYSSADLSKTTEIDFRKNRESWFWGILLASVIGMSVSSRLRNVRRLNVLWYTCLFVAFPAAICSLAVRFAFTFQLSSLLLNLNLFVGLATIIRISFGTIECLIRKAYLSCFATSILLLFLPCSNFGYYVFDLSHVAFAIVLIGTGGILRTLLQVPFRQRHPNERIPSALIDLFLLMISIASLLVALQLIASGDSNWFEYSLLKLDPFDSIIVGLVLSAIGVLLALPFHRTWVKVLTAFVVTGGVASIIGFARGLPSFFELLGVLTPGYVASLPIAYGIQRIEFDKPFKRVRDTSDSSVPL